MSRRPPGLLRARQYWLKRPFDLLLVMGGLLVSLPFWLAVPLAIKLEDRGPVFFVQDRWGRDKRKFRVYKFRTMVPNAVERFGHKQAEANDPRVTRMGRLLRATSLDELPQLLNILKGDMSWVGPRALPIDEVQAREEGFVPDEAIPGFEQRLAVRPGLTGVAQIYAPRDLPRLHKFEYDLRYIERQSLGLDVKLILLSLWITIRARWERREPKV